MPTRPPSPERRAASRPRNGDTLPCPKCGSGRMEFNERYRGVAAGAKAGAVPAWVCDACRHRRIARRKS